MTRHLLRKIISLIIVTIPLIFFVGATSAFAAPVKLVLSGHIKNGFLRSRGVAVAPGGNVYVADTGHSRVQELTPTGEFVLMFGRNVDENTGANICTAASKDKCREGTGGAGAGAFITNTSIAVDHSTGNVYVADTGNSRVQEFTPAGEFVLMFGKDVNEATGGDTCAASEESSCKVGLEGSEGGSEKSAFRFAPHVGGLLAVNGLSNVVYVGGEHRVQEFDATTGEWKTEILLTSILSAPQVYVQAMALDEKANILYLAYGGVSEFPADTVYKFDEKGQQVGSLPVESRKPDVSVRIQAMSVDGAGRLAAIADEGNQPFGTLYNAATSELITEIDAPGFISGTNFNNQGELYVAGEATGEAGEILVYKPVPVAELIVSSPVCKAEGKVETSATFECTLNGAVNPEGVAGTEVWFQWGGSELDKETSKETIAASSTLEPVSVIVKTLRPNKTYNYRLAAEDENVVSPELLATKTETFTTQTAPPVIVGAPHSAFVTSASAVLFGELNPEDASTEYYFEYGPCLENQPTKCVASLYPSKTIVLSSTVYGKIPTALEATSLQPGTTYHYRLAAANMKGEPAVTENGGSKIPEGVLTTTPAPKVQAVTGAPSGIGTTGATVSGLVNPDGPAATYTFELGVYAGPETQYGTVFSGSVGASTTPVEESLALTGLQPGTQYAYRIAIASGYGTSQGALELFKTAGLPAVLEVPPAVVLLAVPETSFPKDASRPQAKCKKGYSRDKRGKCVKTKKKTRSRGKRVTRRQTRLHKK